MAKMEAQIANLTAWVQTALSSRPSSCASDRLSEFSYNSVKSSKPSLVSQCSVFMHTSFVWHDVIFVPVTFSHFDFYVLHFFCILFPLEALVDYSEIAKMLGIVVCCFYRSS